jgi:uncharacterized membrane protein (DUF485 family)
LLVSGQGRVSAQAEDFPPAAADAAASCFSDQETTMEDDLTRRIASHPKYQELKAKRSSFGWWLTGAMMVVYYGFILLVAFDKQLLATRIGEGVTTLGMPIGLAVIVFTIVITAIYVRRANSEFDQLTDDITKAVLK